MARRETEYELQDPAQVSLVDLVAALKALKGEDEETLKKRAQYEAEAHQRLQERENKVHPGISAFNPSGDQKAPKPDLKCRMFWVGYPLEKEGLTPAEVDLLNRVERTGTFSFQRTDGSRDTVTVMGEKDPMGAWSKLEFFFPCKGDHRANLPSMVSMLRDILGMESIEAELQKRVDALEARLAHAS